MESLKPQLNNQEKINPLKSEHLNEGIKPIMVSIGIERMHKNNLEEIHELIKNATFVDFYEDRETLDSQEIKNAGNQTYVISPLDSSNKLSQRYINCTGLLTVGVDKESGKNISLLSHQEPSKFLDHKNNEFTEHMKDSLKQIHSQCIPGTIDSMILGGNYLPGYKDRDYRDKYEKSINKLTSLFKNEFGFEPIVTSGPKTKEGSESLLFDNDNRRVYLVRDYYTQFTKNNEPYLPSEIEQEKEKWSQTISKDGILFNKANQDNK